MDFLKYNLVQNINKNNTIFNHFIKKIRTKCYIICAGRQPIKNVTYM